MTRSLLALLLILGQLPLAAATRRRVVQHPAAPVASAALVAAARKAAETAMAAGVPGLQIAVADHGQVIYSEAFGMTDRESAIATTPRSIMQIGSVTKQFTAAAILRLAERGKLTLDDRIDTYVPEFNSRGATITLRQLLSHTSGVRRDWILFPPPAGFDFGAPVTRAQVIETLNNGQTLNFPPGAAWSYSNAGYMLLGFAIESITGMSYADFIHQEFALPLGLLDTGLCGSHDLPVPKGYVQIPNGSWIRKAPTHPSINVANGAICSTAFDLARWSHLLATGNVVLPASYATMTTPVHIVNEIPVINYGLGFFLQKQLGYSTAWHGGAIDGFQAFLLDVPERDMTIAVTNNAFPAPATCDPMLTAMAVAKVALAAP
ncbi:MAG TPA: serine hydrolase domain-containing protein [Thermoanaerobaculia bacterium]|nr:serine hydrolase domain-containing protein [Thermoanaerobaculia bacterium]